MYASALGSQLIAGGNNPVGHQEWQKISPHVVEKVELQPYSGTVAPGQTVTYRIPKSSGEWVTRLSYNAILRELATIHADCCYMDGVGYGHIESVWIKQGKHEIQLIDPDTHEQALFQNLFMKDEDKAAFDYHTKSGMSVAQRKAAAAVDQEIHVPLFTSFIMHDPANAVFINGLAQEIEVKIKFRKAEEFVQLASGTSLPADGTIAPLWFTSPTLEIEVMHQLEHERQKNQANYATTEGIRMLFDEYQNYRQIVPGSTLLDGKDYQVKLKSFTNPSKCMAFILRWSADLERKSPFTVPANYDANAPRGRDAVNYDGWYRPRGLSNKNIFTHLAIKGSNGVTLLEKTSVHRLLNEHRVRFFPGAAGTAILVVSFARAPYITNACTGFQDPTAAVDLTAYFTTNTSTATGFTNIEDAAQRDLSSGDAVDASITSDLVIDCVNICHQFVDVEAHKLVKPFN